MQWPWVSLIAGLDFPLDCGTRTWDWIGLVWIIVLENGMERGTGLFYWKVGLDQLSYRYCRPLVLVHEPDPNTKQDAVGQTVKRCFSS